MYYNLAFMDYGKELTSTKLTDAMVEISFPVLNWNLKTSAWRHIDIAFKQKLCSKSYDLLTNAESMSSAHALQSEHSFRMENRIYGLTPYSFNGVTEDILQVLLDASTEWQHLFGILPGGVLLRFYQATMDQYSSLHTMGRLPSFMLSKHLISSQPPSPSLLSPLASTMTTSPDHAILERFEQQKAKNNTIIGMLGSLAKQMNSFQSQMDLAQKQHQQSSNFDFDLQILQIANKTVL